MKRNAVWVAALAGLFLLRCESAFAAKKKTDPGLVVEGYISKGIFLYDAASGQSLPVTGSPKPNRIHVRFSAEFNDWVFVLSDLRGKFPDPMEVLVTGAVVNGESVGAPGGRYLFQPGGRWVSTNEPRRLRIIVLGDIPSYKTVSYESAPESPMVFVNPDHKVNFKTYDPFALR